ncbi:MAG TPA: FAD-binding protein, partial [Rhodothermia bacterium]
MALILTYLSVQDDKIKRSSLEALSHSREVARRNGHEVVAALIHPDGAVHASTAARYGADRIVVVSEGADEKHHSAWLLDCLSACARETSAEVVVMASTEETKDLIGALAVRLDAAVVPDVSSFDIGAQFLTAKRPVLASKYLSSVQVAARPVIVSVRSGAYAASESPKDAEQSRLAVPTTFTNVAELVEKLESSGGTVDLSEADVVVAAGRGVRDEAGRALVQDLAGTLNAAIGASRAVVENGLFPATAQIGQTGK